MTNYTTPQKAFVLQTDEGSKIFGPYETQEQMRVAMAEVIKQIEDADSIGQICILEQRNRFTVRKPQTEEVKPVQETKEQIDERDRIPDAPKTQLPSEQETEEVISYRASLEALNDGELRELATLKGVDGRISTRDRLIAELVTIFKLG